MKKRPAPFTFSKGGGRFFQVLEILNLMTLPERPSTQTRKTAAAPIVEGWERVPRDNSLYPISEKIATRGTRFIFRKGFLT